MATVELVNVRKVYRDTEAVRRVNLRITEGEFFSLLGPSGCGKTTTLRMIAGFVSPTEGDVYIGGQNVTHVPPERRDIGIVFQNYAIFPHMNVFGNIAYGLKVRKLNEQEIKRRVGAALATVGLSGYETRYQRELSGGEQQRVALARVLVIEPRILLLDEPLSALDKKLREEMKFWIKGLQQKLQITTVYVTHDQHEALTMSDRLAVMNRGAIEQIGTPREIYEHPSSRFVTDFIGESNILEGKVVSLDRDEVELAFAGQRIRAPRNRDHAIGDSVSFVVRPENVRLGETPNGPTTNHIRGAVRNETYQGALIRYEIDVEGQTIVAELQNTPGNPAFAVAQPLTVTWPVESTAVLVD